MNKKLVFFAALAILFTVCGCRQSVKPADTLAWYENMDSLMADLNAAIADAQKLDSSQICNNLMPIRKDYPGEEWITEDGRDMVLVVTLVDSSRMEKFFGREGVYQIDREMGTWVTIPSEWSNRKAEFEGLDSIGAHMRLLQMFGLSPDCDYDIMVKFYTDPKTLFRPAHDPDITTTSVGLEFPKYADENYKVGETNFREWYRLSVYQAYEDDSPLPWTQLGYTYDWHKGASKVGLSEYIVSHNSFIKVKSCETAWSYVRNL